MIHPGLIGRDEHVGRRCRFDLSGEDGGTCERKRHMLAGRGFVVRPDSCQHVGERGGGENECATRVGAGGCRSDKQERQNGHQFFA